MATPDQSHVEYALFGYSHLAANATTTVKTGSGVLHSISINTKGASANVITVYDNTAGSGTAIAIIDSTAAIGTLFYDVVFNTGLTIVIGMGTAAVYPGP